MFGYVKKQKVLDTSRYLVDFQRKWVAEKIAAIEERKDDFDELVYDKIIQWAFDNETAIAYEYEITDDLTLQSLITAYNYSVREYRAHKLFSDRLNHLLNR